MTSTNLESGSEKSLIHGESTPTFRTILLYMAMAGIFIGLGINNT